MKNIEIKEEDIQKWCEALRSGKYKQCIGALEEVINNETKETGFCCLGVAYIIFIPEDKQVKNEGKLRGAYPTETKNAPLWLEAVNGDFDIKTNYSLSRLNDYGILYDEKLNITDNKPLNKFTFDEIADVLELVYIHKILD